MVDSSSVGSLIAVAAVVAAMVYGSFFGEAGKDLYAWVKRKLWPSEPEPVRVRSNFQPENYSGDLFLWVNEDNVSQRLAEGFSYYRDPEDGAKRFMIANPELSLAEKTFYMWRPGENRSKDDD